MSTKIALALTLILSAADITALADKHKEMTSVFEADKGSDWKIFLTSTGGAFDAADVGTDSKNLVINKDTMKATAFSEGSDRAIQNLTNAQLEYLLDDELTDLPMSAILLVNDVGYPVEVTALSVSNQSAYSALIQACQNESWLGTSYPSFRSKLQDLPAQDAVPAEIQTCHELFRYLDEYKGFELEGTFHNTGNMTDAI
jgi:hypothetical protein